MEGGRKSRDIAVDGITRAAGPYCRNDDRYLDTWWEWVSGSTPFFWNWDKKYQEEVRDGQPHFVTGDFGVFVRRQDPPTTPKDGELVRKKVVQVQTRGYIEVGEVISIIHYFYVKKGPFDVRVVSNGTGCGLNDSIWAPHFGLPTVKQTLRSLLPGLSM